MLLLNFVLILLFILQFQNSKSKTHYTYHHLMNEQSPAPLKYFALVYTGDQILSATVYFDNMSYEDAIQILEHAQAYKVKLCLKRQPDITETEPAIKSDVIPVTTFKLSAQTLCDR